MSKFKLTSGIIALSSADNWDEAKLEWELKDVYHEEVPDECMCGHFPINEICVLQSKVNGHETIVGNVCVKKFMGLRSDKIFDAIRRVSNDHSKGLNAETIDHAHSQMWINDWERKSYFDTMRKRAKFKAVGQATADQ